VPTLYDAPRCPYCARVRIVLAEKRVEHDVVVVDLDERPEWLYAKNPLGKVPVFEDGGWALPESLVIMEYLEERHPGPPLLPDDPADRARVRYRVHRFDGTIRAPYYALRRGEPGAREALAAALDELDAEIAAWTLPFGLADIAYLPWIVRARDLLDVDLSPYPALADWLERLTGRPSVAAELAVVAAL
jgi:glutathione S-transferase